MISDQMDNDPNRVNVNNNDDNDDAGMNTDYTGRVGAGECSTTDQERAPHALAPQATNAAGTTTTPLTYDSSRISENTRRLPRWPVVAMRRGVVGLMLAVALIFGMVLGGAGAGTVMLVSGHTLAATSTTTATTGGPSSPEMVTTNQTTTDIGTIYQKASASVVRISVRVQSRGRFRVGGEAVGTGMIIDAQGHILTNYHIIEGASSIRVELADGSEYTAYVTGTSPQDDLAVIQVTAPADKLVPIQLGDSSTVRVGDEVIAIGYPYGLDQSVTEGIVSGLDREGTGSNGGSTLTGLIQTDAAINPGNSGGPLLNVHGQVIGVNTMIESPVNAFTGVGLAIPINHVKEVLAQLVQGS
jgi:putative serine protease PepD